MWSTPVVLLALVSVTPLPQLLSPHSAPTPHLELQVVRQLVGLTLLLLGRLQVPDGA
jgi:hypothetical protein